MVSRVFEMGQGLCWGLWCVRHFSDGCYGILYKRENVLLC